MKAGVSKRGLWDTISAWRAEAGPDFPELILEEVSAWRDRTPAEPLEAVGWMSEAKSTI